MIGIAPQCTAMAKGRQRCPNMATHRYTRQQYHRGRRSTVKLARCKDHPLANHEGVEPINDGWTELLGIEAQCGIVGCSFYKDSDNLSEQQVIDAAARHVREDPTHHVALVKRVRKLLCGQQAGGPC